MGTAKRSRRGAASPQVVEKGCVERFLGLTGPMGRRVLRFDGPCGPKGCGIALRAMSIYAVSRQFILAPTGAVPPQRQRGFITTLGGALKQSGRRQPVPDRTLGAQGRQPRRLHQPSRRSRVNLWKYSLPPSPLERSEHNPSIQPAAKRRPLFCFREYSMPAVCRHTL